MVKPRLPTRQSGHLLVQPLPPPRLEAAVGPVAQPAPLAFARQERKALDLQSTSLQLRLAVNLADGAASDAVRPKLKVAHIRKRLPRLKAAAP